MKSLAIVVLMVALASSTPQNMAQQPGSPAQLSGVFRAQMPGDTAGAGPSFFLAFFPDGHVMRGAPGVGLAGYNAAYQMNLDIRSGIPTKVWRWGVYHVSGQQAQLDFANRDSVAIDLKNYPRTVEAVGLTYVLLDPGDGLSLQGLYRSTKDNSAINFLPGSMMNQQGIVANCVSGGQHFSYGGSVPSMTSAAQLCLDKPSSGGYRLGSYTIQFVMPDSTTPTFAFWADLTQNRVNPPAIYIDGVKFVLAN
jgi:hypothetical protein